MRVIVNDLDAPCQDITLGKNSTWLFHQNVGPPTLGFTGQFQCREYGNVIAHMQSLMLPVSRTTWFPQAAQIFIRYETRSRVIKSIPRFFASPGPFSCPRRSSRRRWENEVFRPCGVCPWSGVDSS